MADRLPVSPENISLALAALCFEPEVELVPGSKPGNRHHEVTPGITDQALDAALVVAFPRPPVAIPDQVMREKPAEQLGPLANAVWQDASHQAPALSKSTDTGTRPKKAKA